MLVVKLAKSCGAWVGCRRRRAHACSQCVAARQGRERGSRAPGGALGCCAGGSWAPGCGTLGGMGLEGCRHGMGGSPLLPACGQSQAGAALLLPPPPAPGSPSPSPSPSFAPAPPPRAARAGKQSPAAAAALTMVPMLYVAAGPRVWW